MFCILYFFLLSNHEFVRRDYLRAKYFWRVCWRPNRRALRPVESQCLGIGTNLTSRQLGPPAMECDAFSSRKLAAHPRCSSEPRGKSQPARTEKSWAVSSRRSPQKPSRCFPDSAQSTTISAGATDWPNALSMVHINMCWKTWQKRWSLPAVFRQVGRPLRWLHASRHQVARPGLSSPKLVSREPASHHTQAHPVSGELSHTRSSKDAMTGLIRHFEGNVELQQQRHTSGLTAQKRSSATPVICCNNAQLDRDEGSLGCVQLRNGHSSTLRITARSRASIHHKKMSQSAGRTTEALFANMGAPMRQPVVGSQAATMQVVSSRPRWLPGSGPRHVALVFASCLFRIKQNGFRKLVGMIFHDDPCGTIPFLNRMPLGLWWWGSSFPMSCTFPDWTRTFSFTSTAAHLLQIIKDDAKTSCTVGIFARAAVERGSRAIDCLQSRVLAMRNPTALLAVCGSTTFLWLAVK